MKYFPMKNVNRRQRGQSMVEYTVVLVALTLAVISTVPGECVVGDVVCLKDDVEGRPNDKSLLKVAADKYRGHTYALSVSEYPESENPDEIYAYYQSLNKFNGLSVSEINTVHSKSGSIQTALGRLEGYLDPNLTDRPPSEDSCDAGELAGC